MGRVFLTALLLAALLCPAIADIVVATDPGSIGVGARPLGMGKAFLTFNGDPVSVFLNPAGLATIKNLAISSMSAKLISQYNYNNLAVALPSRVGVFSLAYVGSGISFVSSGETYAHNSDLLVLGWAPPPTRYFNFGATAKMYYGGLYGQGTKSGTFTGYNLDLGLQYKPNRTFTWGLFLQNVIPFSMGGKIRWQDGTDEYLPRFLKAGLRTKILGEDGLYALGQQRLAFVVDGDVSQLASDCPIVYHGGLEWTPAEALDIRFGLNQDASPQSGGGYAIANNLTTGIGFYFGDFRFDYAFHQYFGVTENDTHYFSLSYGVKREKPEPDEDLLPTAPPLRKKILRGENFSDVGDKYWAQTAILELKKSRIVLGYPDGKFVPDRAITRAEMATLIARGRSISQPFKITILPSDVLPNSWYAYYVSEVMAAGIMQGDPAGNFEPNGTINRAEAAVIMARFARLPLGRPLEPPYSDVPGRHFAVREITAAKEAGLFSFINDETMPFEPKKNLTRAEAAELLTTTADLRDYLEKFYEYED